MATRTRRQWKPDAQGRFSRQIGWKVNSTANRQQHKFRLGSDLKEAKRRDNLLQQMWEAIEQMQPTDPMWTDDTLEVAKKVAQGQSPIHVPRRAGEESVPYAHRVHQLRKSFPMIYILSEVQFGVSPGPEECGALLGVAILSHLDEAYERTEREIEEQRRTRNGPERWRLGLGPDGSSVNVGPMLHNALRDYTEWLKEECAHPESGITAWGNTQTKQVQTLIDHHIDLPIAVLDHTKVEELLRYWRQRPHRKGTVRPVSKDSAENCVGALRKFLKWLHKSDKYDWRLPEGFQDLNTRVTTLETDRRKQVTPERLFTRDELTLLYKYGSPLDRLLILLGINCGFGAAESASLVVDEIHLRTPHTKRQQEILNHPSTADESFIKRVRPKSGVYGEFLLFGHTVQGIEWALKRRRRQPEFGAGARLLLNGKGEPFDKQTKSGNRSQQIPNMFGRLIKRVRDDENEITRLPFNVLRKTGGDLVKRFSNGEVKGVFLFHGQPVRTDDLDDVYSTRPFGKVFQAIQKVEEYLQPMFEATGPNPFESVPQAYTSRKTIDRIVELRQQGTPVQEIASEVGKSPSTVHRHVNRRRKPR